MSARGGGCRRLVIGRFKLVILSLLLIDQGTKMSRVARINRHKLFGSQLLRFLQRMNTAKYQQVGKFSR